MSKSVKGFICGFIMASALFIGIVSISAATQTVQAKLSDVTYIIDGKSCDLESLNYNNKNRVPVRDLAEKMGATVSVENNTVVIKSKLKVTVTPKPPVVDPKPKQTPDGITQIDTYQGKYYISLSYIEKKIAEKGYILWYDHDVWSIKKDDKIVIGNLSYTSVYGYSSLEYDYYVNVVMPLII